MKWIKIDLDDDDCRPPIAIDILFTDGVYTYCGWLESYEECEDLTFFDAIDREFVDEVTHWMELPEPVEKE
jgi:hypothetical protein